MCAGSLMDVEEEKLERGIHLTLLYRASVMKFDLHSRDFYYCVSENLVWVERLYLNKIYFSLYV